MNTDFPSPASARYSPDGETADARYGCGVNAGPDCVSVNRSFASAHGLNTGDAVTYSSGGTPITGLTSGKTYFAIVDSTTTLRFAVRSDFPVKEPELRLSKPPTVIGGAYHGCTSHSPDLMEASRNATRYLIDWLCRETRCTPEDAYILSSVAAELRISQIVDAPNWTVTAFFPLAVLSE